MPKLPEPRRTVAALVDEYHERNGNRDYGSNSMGASQIGHECDRWLWLSFRWAVKERFNGRILRLFRRGQNEEDIIVKDLRSIGIDIRKTGKNQQRVEFGCHVAGVADGIIHGGVPEAPKKKHVAEFKTHSKKSFDALEKNGVEKAKPLHWVQMQCYMLALNIDRGLYVAVCKDDDRLYTERVELKRMAAKKIISRAQSIAVQERMPEPLSTDPTWYQCRFCPAHKFCHESKQIEAKQVNCRTCAHATPTRAGTWECARHGGSIPNEFQRAGCDDHVIHPDLVPWDRVESADEWQAVYKFGDRLITNGHPDANVFGSKELLSNLEACLSDEPAIAKIRDIFDAQITEGGDA